MSIESITPEDLNSLELKELVVRMDKILASPYWGRMGNDILKLNVQSIYDSIIIRQYAPSFQRKLTYKAFGLLLQLQYADLSSSANFFHLPEHDEVEAKQIYSAARDQWTTVSSRMAFEYFMHLTYMLESGADFPCGKSAFKKYKKWLKKPGNEYSYFSISAARAMSFDRSKRSPEVHASTKLARRVLLLSATDIDNDIFQLINLLKNQWQFILDIVNGREPNGWAVSGKADGDKEWYEVWETKNEELIDRAIDDLFSNKSIEGTK